MNSQPVLLNDDQMKSFLLNGFLVLKPQLPEAFHKFIFNAMEANPPAEKSGNNCLPTLPALNQVFDDPVVSGALSSLLGPSFGMHPHRAVHLSRPGKNQQQWHRDTFWGYKLPIRYPHPTMVMAMYYPQETTLKMGPTGIKPGTQYFTIDPKRYQGSLPNHFVSDSSSDKSVICPAGSVCIIHYDLIHKGTANTSTQNRYMFKFQFYRNEFPQKPSWNCSEVKWTGWPKGLETSLSMEEVQCLEPICCSLWNWLCGSVTVFDPPTLSAKDHQTMVSLLDADSEWSRFRAAFQLSLCGDISLLITRLSHPDAQFSLCAAYALSAAPLQYHKEWSESLAKVAKAPGDAQMGALWALSEWGYQHLIKDTLIEMAQSPRVNTSIRQYAVQALGGSKQFDQSMVDALGEAMLAEKADDQLRMMAAMAFNTAAPYLKGTNAQAWLSRGLGDYHRYIQGYSLEALLRLGTPEASQIALNYLKATRWCPITTANNPF